MLTRSSSCYKVSTLHVYPGCIPDTLVGAYETSLQAQAPRGRCVDLAMQPSPAVTEQPSAWLLTDEGLHVLCPDSGSSTRAVLSDAPLSAFVGDEPDARTQVGLKCMQASPKSVSRRGGRGNSVLFLVISDGGSASPAEAPVSIRVNVLRHDSRTLQLAKTSACRVIGTGRQLRRFDWCKARPAWGSGASQRTDWRRRHFGKVCEPPLLRRQLRKPPWQRIWSS